MWAYRNAFAIVKDTAIIETVDLAMGLGLIACLIYSKVTGWEPSWTENHE